MAAPAQASEALGQALGIECANVTVSFDAPDSRVTALQNVSLRVEPSEFVCLIGPSGCGKTTFLNVVAGFLKPTAGQVRIGGRPVVEEGLDKGVVFQEYALFPWRTAVENVEFGLEMKGLPASERREIATRFLGLVKLEDFAGTYPHHLSGGMKQRVAIARALAYDPTILLMDEPFGALDSFTREELQRLLVEVWQQTRKTLLYVTHNIAEAAHLADRIVVLTPRPGRIRAIVDVDLPRPRNHLTSEFLEVQRAVAAQVIL